MRTLIKLEDKYRIEPIIGTGVFFLFGFWGVFECVYGILQVFHITSSANPFFILMGSFPNPGPYGGFVATISAIMMAYLFVNRGVLRKRHHIPLEYMFAILVLCLCILVLPATMSRAAWLGLFVAVIIMIARDAEVISYVKSHSWIILLTVLLSIVCIVCIFFLKKDSALGRFHIWDIETRAIVRNPIRGTGANTFQKTYGDIQAEYFAKKQRSLTRIRIAGCPEYPFNEYLGIGVERGALASIIFAILMVSTIIRLLKKNNVLAYGLIVWSVFAFFSYPLYTWQLRTVLFSIMAIAWMPKCGTRQKPNEVFSIIAAILISVFIIYPVGRNDKKNKEMVHQLYVEGQDLFQNGEYEESFEAFKKGAGMSCDPIFHVLMGRNLEAFGLYEEAENEYRHAYYMIPFRIYPKFRLMRLYISTGNDDKALVIARDISSSEINTGHQGMTELQKSAASTLDSLIQVAKNVK